MASYENWMNRRKGRPKGDLGLYRLDPKKTPEENIIDIIQGLYVKKAIQTDVSPTNKHLPHDVRSISIWKSSHQTVSDSRRVSYLTALVALLCNTERNSLGFTFEELMTCIRISLVEESAVVRASALRVLRYLIKTEEDVTIFNALKLPFLVTRSLDLMTRNEEERTQALRVIRRTIAVVGPSGTSAAARRSRGVFVETGMLRCLVAISKTGNGSDGSGDRLARPATATIAEVGVIDAQLAAASGASGGAWLRALSACGVPRLLEALCGAALHQLDTPQTRLATTHAGLPHGHGGVAPTDLAPLAAPYADLPAQPHAANGHGKQNDNTDRDEREMRFTCSRLALLCVLRSWGGILHFCHPYSTGGLKALIQSLHLPRLEVRKAILDLLYELLGLPQPEWTDEISVALAAIDPADFQDGWRLNEGFVAAEGAAVLPTLAATGPDLTEIHLALLLHCFLDGGLLDALAEVIVTSDTFISVRATVLIGQIVHLSARLVPGGAGPAPLAALVARATSGHEKALPALAALRTLRTLLAARPASKSLYLDHILNYCSGTYLLQKEDSKTKKEQDNRSIVSPRYKDSVECLNESESEEPKQRHSIGSRADIGSRNVSALVKSKSVSSRTSAAVSKVTKTKFFNLFERESDSLIRCSLVMQNKDGNTWNWEIIRTILKEDESNRFLNLSDSGHKAWVARIISYLKPSHNKYSHTELSSLQHSPTRAACQLVTRLSHCDTPDTVKLLEDLFTDVSRHIAAIESGRSAHECLFSPAHMGNTLCQTYFLLVAQLCHSQQGLDIFYRSRLYHNLLDLSTKTHHTCYVKLIISSLDYTIDSYPREILAKTLTCNIQVSRLYATQFLNVLLRASQKSKELVRKKMKRSKSYDQGKERCGDANRDMESWALELLVGQLKDESKAVVKCTLSILEEACHVPSYLEKLISLRHKVGVYCHFERTAEPTLDQISSSACGDRGYMLWLQLEVAALGACPSGESAGFLKRHLDFWARCYNCRYVSVVEGNAQSALAAPSSLRGASRRGNRTRHTAAAPTHLYSALAASHVQALQSHLQAQCNIIKQGKCSCAQETMELKAAIWAVASCCHVTAGLNALTALTHTSEPSGVELIVNLAQYCPVYSVRAAAFYSLGVVATTNKGANLLQNLGWHSVRHTRNDKFPIISEELASGPDSGATLHYRHTAPHYTRTYTPRHYEPDRGSQGTTNDHTLPNNTTIADIERDQIDGSTKFTQIDKRKSHTLPSSQAYDRPTISESKTVDVLKDYSTDRATGPDRLLVGRMNSLDTYEGRVRNISESSTSGVSSCDSVLGRYVFPDRVLTLSPIPSSSSLYGMRGHRTRLTDHQRRTSSHSYTCPDTTNSPPSQKDMVGYATLKSLNKHRRPLVSESAACPPGEVEELSWILSESARRSKPFSSLRVRTSKQRDATHQKSLLEYDWRPLSRSESNRRLSTSPPRELSVPRSVPREDERYMGICLPLATHNLFPRVDSEEAVADSFAVDTSFLLDSSSLQDNKLNTSTDNEQAFNKDDVGSHRPRARPHSRSACLVCVSPSTGDLREAFFASIESRQSDGAQSPTQPAEPITPQDELLHHAHFMANPIHYRATRPALIALKQRHPAVFRCACVYSDVCGLLARGTYMCCARRFLQELFLDVNFDAFQQAPKDILARRLPSTHAPPTS